MIASYAAEIKIVIFQSISQRQGDDCHIAAKLRQKLHVLTA